MPIRRHKVRQHAINFLKTMGDLEMIEAEARYVYAYPENWEGWPWNDYRATVLGLAAAMHALPPDPTEAERSAVDDHMSRLQLTLWEAIEAAPEPGETEPEAIGAADPERPLS